MTNNIQKKKKRSEQIAIEIENHVEEYENSLQESKRILEIKEREYETKLNDLVTKNDEYKKDIILRLGKMLEKYGLAGETYKISARLKRDLKGYIDRNMIYRFALDEWRDKSFNRNPEGGRNRSQNQNSSTKIRSTEVKPLTEYEKQFVEVHDQKVYHNEHIEALIDYYLGMTQEEKTDIIANTPKDTDYQNVLIEKAKDNILKIVKRLNDVDIAPFMADIRFLGKIHRVVSDVAYEEQQLRKKKQGMMGK